MTISSMNRLPDPALAARDVIGRVALLDPPVDLRSIVSLWPNLTISEEELDGAGYLLPIGEIGGTILVNKADKEERRRFTIAHELGHWVLGLASKSATGHFSQPSDVPYTTVERWCDQFATNLLMPEPLLRATVSKNDPALVPQSVAQAPGKFKVSDQALYIRIWEVLRFQVAFVGLSGEGRRREAHVERSFGNEEVQSALQRALAKAEVVDHLNMGPFIYLSLSSPEGRIHCPGRRLGANRLLLVLMWPNGAASSDHP